MNLPCFKKKIYLSDVLWDCWCIASIIGIWPRFIEPNIVGTTKLTLPIPRLPPALAGLKILQFSDLHLHAGVSDAFLNKLTHKIKELAPDLLVFTGDFLCFSRLDCQKKRLENFLQNLSAPYGCYAIYGNHDYQRFVSINANGEYDIIDNRTSMIQKGFSRIFAKTVLAKKATPAAKVVEVHRELADLLQNTPFEILENTSQLMPIKGTGLNICGLGEHMLGKCLPEQAFKSYDRHYPGLILAHNPDSVPLLQNYPGEIILCGHTHGGQINLPWLWKKFTLLENMQFKKGLFHLNNKWVYVNKGVGSAMQFRWFAMPEITLITLEKSHAI